MIVSINEESTPPASRKGPWWAGDRSFDAYNSRYFGRGAFKFDPKGIIYLAGPRQTVQKRPFRRCSSDRLIKRDPSRETSADPTRPIPRAEAAIRRDAATREKNLELQSFVALIAKHCRTMPRHTVVTRRAERSRRVARDTIGTDCRRRNHPVLFIYLF